MEAELPRRAMEAVAKAPFAATIVLPGYDVSGNVYLLPDADPGKAPMLANRHFIPVTDATITTAGSSSSWSERIMVVNLARSLFYTPRTGKRD